MTRRKSLLARLALGAAAVVAAGLLAGCASFDGRGLVPGRSTMAEVEALMGAPDLRLALPGGDTALYFPRLLEGRMMFAAVIGPDGVMKSLEQRLERSNLAKVVAGVSTREDVRILFGPPGRIGRLARQQREWWEYRYLDFADRRVFWVQFSDDGLAREVIDLRERDEGRPSLFRMHH